jgi:hypothetical protein
MLNDGRMEWMRFEDLSKLRVPQYSAEVFPNKNKENGEPLCFVVVEERAVSREERVFTLV